MGDTHFDALTRALFAVGSRREALATLAGALGLLALARVEDAKAAKTGKCKPKCGECETCKKGDCERKNSKTVCKKGKCKAKADGTACSIGTCQGGGCVTAVVPPPPPPTCPGQTTCPAGSEVQCCAADELCCPAGWGESHGCCPVGIPNCCPPLSVLGCCPDTAPNCCGGTSINGCCPTGFSTCCPEFSLTACCPDGKACCNTDAVCGGAPGSCADGCCL